MTKIDFCPCTDFTCELNPVNHDKGCTLCVEDSIKTRELPKCFFEKAVGTLEGITDWSFESFAKTVQNKK